MNKTVLKEVSKYKTLLFTGAGGFLGRNILPVLQEAYDVSTIGLSEDDTYQINIATTAPQLSECFEIVLHAAGKAHMTPKTKEESQAFYDVNYQGTVNLCRALENIVLPKAFIFISTVAVYGCDVGENISEEHPLNGITPYADSKKMAEEFLIDWCEQHNVTLSIIRPPLIAGPDAPGNLGAMVEAIKHGRYLNIAGGSARKSVLMVQDIARLIPLLVDKGGVYNVCDNTHPSMKELALLIATQLGKGKPMGVPADIIKLVAKIGDCLGRNFPINSLRYIKLTSSLTFSNEKAKRELGWEPLGVLENYKI